LGLVGFFLDDPHLRHEFLSRPSTTGGSIICSDRSASAQQLFAKYVGSPTGRQRIDDTKNGDGKRLGSSHQLGTRHDLSLPIRNPQSAIRN